MKKQLKNFLTIVVSIFFVAATGCKSGTSDSNGSDTAVMQADSMPTVQPNIGDTSGSTVTPPPTNDQNSIMPDSVTIAQ